MFDTEAFVASCIAARAESEPRLAIKEILSEVMARPAEVASALPPDRARVTALHVAGDLTIINVVWAPRMSFGPHDHRMWATIGLYSGGEDNTFFRRDRGSIVESGGKQLRSRDVCLLGDDAVHAVTNPTREFAGAIHIYGGDFFTTARSEWTGTPYEEQPYDVQRTLAYFEEANATG
jgi:predicted metal-dependent enzyme (double-stranded beta helix superfamily)